MKQGYVYILASRNNGVLYVGVTSQLQQRVWQHKERSIDGFTKKYHVHKLVYYETHQSMMSAIEREKRIKRWKREWENNLISSVNPYWVDLYEQLEAF